MIITAICTFGVIFTAAWAQEYGLFDNDVPSAYYDDDAAWDYMQTFTDLMTKTPFTGEIPGVNKLRTSRNWNPSPEGPYPTKPAYDYIVVGAGSAGSTLAARLSEGGRSSVLLLEAGQYEIPLMDLPLAAAVWQFTDYTEQYYMEPQPGVCMAMADQRCFWPRGKSVGGTSSINYMIYTRGRPLDWDRIAMDGNYGWSWNNVLPYFLRSERANLKKYSDSIYHNTTGELSVQDIKFRTKLASAFLKSAKQLGHEIVDYNSPDGFGFDYFQTTTESGRRFSVAKAFLRPRRNQKNLCILPEAKVLKVLIDDKTKTAHSVVYLWNNKRYTVQANREVILSAGPIASPQLLMLSGVGPDQHLREMGIPVIQNLNVGQTLYDHISFPGLVFLINTTKTSILMRNALTVSNLIQWQQYGDGPLSVISGLETLGYIKTQVSKEPGDHPDIELIGAGLSLVSDDGLLLRRSMKITDDFYNKAYGSIIGRESFAVIPVLIHPKSKGYLKLKDANPLSHPKLYGNYLTHPDDAAAMVAAIRHSIKIALGEPFQKFGVKLHDTPFPTCAQHKFDTDAYWECAVRSVTYTVHHQIATCRMGPESDTDAVVDPELRVYGIKRLRVVDTSVIPRTNSAHTNAPGIMIGEKAADMIKDTWGDF